MSGECDICGVTGCVEMSHAAPPLPSALAGVTAEELRDLAESCEGVERIHFAGRPPPGPDNLDRAAAILRALADSIEKTEGKP